MFLELDCKPKVEQIFPEPYKNPRFLTGSWWEMLCNCIAAFRYFTQHIKGMSNLICHSLRRKKEKKHFQISHLIFEK